MAAVRSQRVAIVTGANRGLGLALARVLAQRDFTVWLTARDEGQARAASKPLIDAGFSVYPHALDVTSQNSTDALIRDVRGECGRLDVLLNNAGVSLDTASGPSRADLDMVRATLEVNLMGAWRMCKACVPLMLEGRFGRIVNVSSDMGTLSTAGPDYPAYRVSKAALNMLTASLAAELRGRPILVNACCPGWLRTDMGGPHAPLSAEEGTDTPIWLATLPDDGPTGGLFQRRRRISW
jgi:NAD(P)-dependent dehydrogenase (short-subunit alcohol dehydrogenase family)